MRRRTNTESCLTHPCERGPLTRGRRPGRLPEPWAPSSCESRQHSSPTTLQSALASPSARGEDPQTTRTAPCLLAAGQLSSSTRLRTSCLRSQEGKISTTPTQVEHFELTTRTKTTRPVEDARAEWAAIPVRILSRSPRASGTAVDELASAVATV